MGGRAASIAGRIIALGILVACIAYLCDELVRSDRDWIFGSKPGGGTILGALLASLVFGIPSAHYLVKGSLPFTIHSEEGLAESDSDRMRLKV
ncbi:hypothetical protein EON81_20420, partial [bacterium]